MPQRYTVGSVSHHPPGTIKSVTAGNQALALFNVNGRFYAIEDRCSHEGALLSEGELDGTTVVCPWHNAEFDVTCGKALCPPASEDINSFPVHVVGDAIEVEL